MIKEELLRRYQLTTVEYAAIQFVPKPTVSISEKCYSLDYLCEAKLHL